MIDALEDLPAFADDRTLGRALLGSKRAGEWPGLAALLEGKGLPKIDGLMGGRYVPAVRAFFNSMNGLEQAKALMPDGVEDLGAWRRTKKRPA